MVLCLKTRESRSLPGLSRISLITKQTARGARAPKSSSAAFAFGNAPKGNAHNTPAGWSSPVARQAHNLKVVSSNLAPATKISSHTKTPAAQKPRAFLRSGLTSGKAGRRRISPTPPSRRIRAEDQRSLRAAGLRRRAPSKRVGPQRSSSFRRAPEPGSRRGCCLRPGAIPPLPGPVAASGRPRLPRPRSSR